MSGIVGIIRRTKDSLSPVLLKKMTDAIAHRDLDNEGHYIDRFAGLGYRHLDIDGSHPIADQPRIDSTGRYAIAFSGRIYNESELRAQLQGLGHQFRSQSDAEVVVTAYLEWGPESVRKLNGLFAFIIWDIAEERFFIARDRYGAAPLYYCLTDDVFVIASEQKAILAYPGISRDIDLEAVFEYFTFQNIFTDRTFFKGIKLFPAANYCYVKLEMDKIAPCRYWDYDFREPDRPLREEEYSEELDRLFRQAVGRQLVGTTEIGAYLSGGIDSGSIVAIAAPQMPGMKTFTCGFDMHSVSGLELTFDERETAEHLSYLFKTEHYEMVLKAGDMERAMPRVAYHIEEPRVGQSYPDYYAAQLASKFVKVVLAGGGGDELFGGYPWRYYRVADCTDFDDYIDKYYLYWQRLASNTELRKMFAPVAASVENVWTRDIFERIFPEDRRDLSRPEDYVNNALYLEAKTFLHGLLVVDYKLAMAHGVETRLPFLDNDLVDFAMKLPVSLKVRSLQEAASVDENDIAKKNLLRKSNDGKQLMRKVMGRYVPEFVTGAQKQGFSAPDGSWFKGESLDYVRRRLCTSSAAIYKYLDQPTVTDLIEDHLEGRQNRRLLIWSLLSFEEWLRLYHG